MILLELKCATQQKFYSSITAGDTIIQLLFLRTGILLKDASTWAFLRSSGLKEII
jgi:hypothetical protein